jgi:hypothetical protein
LPARFPISHRAGCNGTKQPKKEGAGCKRRRRPHAPQVRQPSLAP